VTITAPATLFELAETPSAWPVVKDEAIRNGEVFTRRWVVEMILDWVGYDPERDLAACRLVDPACGGGAFLEAVTERLSASCRKHDRSIAQALPSVRAWDLLDEHVQTSRRLVRRILEADGWPAEDVDDVVSAWIQRGDYLLDAESPADVDFVVGNPPYIRLEDIPAERMARYRRLCPTMVGRADIYVGFFERGLRSLKPGGKLGFICADRWMRNQYGRALRSVIERDFSVEVCITMHDVDAFEEQVSAYPAVTVIANKPQERAVVAEAAEGFGAMAAAELRFWAQQPASTSTTTGQYRAARLPTWFRGEYSWPTGGPARLAVIEQLNEEYRPLQDSSTGTRVGIGVATGADAVFITTDEDAVEPERLLPLALVRDISSGRLCWSGSYLINPWNELGALVDLRAHPRLRRYLAAHEGALRDRYVGRRQPANWYRTIDKVSHDLTGRPKLLVPDMKTFAHPVLDPGGCYPHHNLYYVVSDVWDLEVLGGLLLSRVAEAFVEAYAVKMRGGTLRFQAQYLRRIRVPDPSSISVGDRTALAEAFNARDRVAATEAALRVYGLAELPDQGD